MAYKRKACFPSVSETRVLRLVFLHKEVTVTDIQDRLECMSTTANYHLGHLTTEGYLKRKIVPGQARAYAYSLTERGQILAKLAEDLKIGELSNGSR